MIFKNKMSLISLSFGYIVFKDCWFYIRKHYAASVRLWKGEITIFIEGSTSFDN